MSRLMAKAKNLAKMAESGRAKILPDNIFQVFGMFDMDSPRTQLQMSILDKDRRFNSRAIHRRFGKSVMEIAKLFDRAIENPFPRPRYAYFAPTYSQAADIAWVYLSDFHTKLCEAMGLQAQPLQAKSELSVSFPTRAGEMARIRLYGLDSPKQRIRGLYLDGAVFDEWPWIPPSAWTAQVRPMLADVNRSGNDLKGRRNQWADFTFTPFGRDHAWEMHEKARKWSEGLTVVEVNPLTGEEMHQRRDDWSYTHLPADETKVLSEEELMSLEIELGPERYKQEMLCHFDATVEGSIFGRAITGLRERGSIGRIPHIPSLPVHTAFDLGFDDDTAIWFFQRVGDWWHFIDYAELVQAPYEAIADLLAEKDYRYGTILLPHDADQETQQGAGRSARQQLQDLGVRGTVVPKVGHLRDAIRHTERFLQYCRFDEDKCQMGLDRLSLYRRRYDESKRVYSENPVHDRNSHAASAMMQAARAERMVRAHGHAEHRPERAEL